MPDHMPVRRRAIGSSGWRHENRTPEGTAPEAISWGGHRFEQIALRSDRERTLADASGMSGDRWHVLPFALSHTMSASVLYRRLGATATNALWRWILWSV